MPPRKESAGPDLGLFRNIGVVAHIDAGKTTTTEHLLFYAGVKHKLGDVDSGNTQTDYDPEEQERGITIYSACIPFPWKDCTVNLIDTPGHVDFTAEVERSLRVLDGAVVVFDAQKGVEAQSETVWRQADKYGVPRLVFINKMDVVGADFRKTIGIVRDRLECRPVPIFIPIGAGSKESAKPLAGIIDLLEQKALYFNDDPTGKVIRAEAVPEDMADEVAESRQHLFDVLTENDPDDRITSLVLEGQDPPLDAVRQLIREQTIKRLIQPVLCGSGREHVGIQPILDAVCWYLPSPLDRPPVEGVNPKKGEKVEKRKPDVKEPLCGLVFKIVAHPSGDRAFVRLYSGHLKPNSRLYNPARDYKENVGKLYHVHADPRRDLEEIPDSPAGDILVIVGLKESVTGDTLCETAHPILLERITFAETVVSQVIEPESSAEKDKLVAALKALQREDPTFIVKVNEETGQTEMSGMGTLHLEVKRHRLERDFKVKARVRKPQVSYRETIGHDVLVDGECDRVLGTTRQFARMAVQFRRMPGNQPVRVSNRVADEAAPAPLVAAAERGLKDSLSSGTIGYPVLSVEAVLMGVSFDPAASTEVAFEAAAADAVRKAFEGNAVLLEPIMAVEVDVPEEYVGGVQGDLMQRLAVIEEQDVRGNRHVMKAKVPLSRMFDYADKVRSVSGGRAGYSVTPASYEEAPPDVRRRLMEGEYA